MKYYIPILSFFFILSCSKDAINTDIDSEEGTDNTLPNIMLIIADDMGHDATPGFNRGTIKPNMPNLQAMIDTGIRFNNLWSYATCTPTRASILTGKYGFNSNVISVGDVLSTSEVSLQRYLDTKTSSAYAHAVIGKWHLSSNTNHPTEMGINYYTGSISGGVQSYWDWNLVQNGVSASSTEYTTTKFTDLAIDWVDEQTKPWFLWLAYNAPHTPFHLPDTELHSQGTLPTDDDSISNNPLPYYMAMLEAMDTELGRLLASMSQEEKDNTIFIFIGDNGTPNQVAQEYNSRRVKGSIYQGGINVPMVISGKGVFRSNETEDALINTTDLFATIADIAGAGSADYEDSQSFKALLEDTNATQRDYVFAERRNDNTGLVDYSVRNATHKYIAFGDGSEGLYNLSTDALEGTNLLNANQLPLNSANAAVKEELVNTLEKIKP
ncbi:sulfatase-like hydrolase/transferase [uncultured Maribacter sp.]|uniref:sulfatase-like hydrolase/transferase n=1 Tax=uncultured Maribacter sp. TaxID=431308 RepID=UPI00263797CD|nr:sulfatase-like hydrolase/transferase [uncultured Maribacter sp.]